MSWSSDIQTTANPLEDHPSAPGLETAFQAHDAMLELASAKAVMLLSQLQDRDATPAQL
jgi:hypothetical protein